MCIRDSKEGAVVVQKVREGKGDFGYNARTDVYENLHAAGVVDPAKVCLLYTSQYLLMVYEFFCYFRICFIHVC